MKKVNYQRKDKKANKNSMLYKHLYLLVFFYI